MTHRVSALAAAVVCVLSLSAAAHAQVRKLHTRDLTRLSQIQTADYLKRSDIVFIPVGAVETNGIMPSDRDYVSPLAYAMTMAEQTDSLYMPGLVWSYPGTTVIAESTIYLSPGMGTVYLKVLAKSLLRQGFRRQVYISASQGPAPLTVGTLVREFFEETQVPILYIELDRHLPRLNLAPADRDKLIYGAHLIADRLDDLPLKGDYGEAESKASAPVPENEGLAALGKLGFSGSLTLGSFISDVMAHGGSNLVLPASAAEREDWGRQGKAQLEAIVKKMRIPEAMAALRKHDEFTQKVILPKYEKMLPGPTDHR
jgi:creatinine amidohydrolase